MASSGSHPPPLVVVGASAGGVEALRELMAHLPADFPGCVLVVLHLPSTGSSALPVILDRAGPLPVRGAAEGDRLEAGQVLVGVPDHHLIVTSETVTLGHGPHENGHRPAVDVLFRSAARHHGGQVVAVVLSGALDDGASGMVAVRRRGGHGLAQDFDDALHSGMPKAAARAGGLHDDDVLPTTKIAARVNQLVRELPYVAEADGTPEPSSLMEREIAMAQFEPAEIHETDRPGDPAGLGCPSCGGALFQIAEGGFVRFRCRVGHAWSPETLLERQTVALEGALWMALRSLEEKVALNGDLAERARSHGHPMTAARFDHAAEEARHAAGLVRRLVDDLASGSAATTD